MSVIRRYNYSSVIFTKCGNYQERILFAQCLHAYFPSLKSKQEKDAKIWATKSTKCILRHFFSQKTHLKLS